MKNLLKYETYKTLHRTITYVVLVICCAVSLIFTNNDYLSDPIVPGTTNNLMGIFMNEVADAGIAILILVGCFMIYSFGTDLNDRCINFEFMSGNSRKRIFLCKYIYMFLLSGSMIVISLFVGCCKFGINHLVLQVMQNGEYFLRTILLVYVVSFSIISVCIFFALAFKDTAKTTIVSFVVLFISCYIMAAVANGYVIEGHMKSAYEITSGWVLLYPPYLWRWMLNPNLNSAQLVFVLIVTGLWSCITFHITRCLFCSSEFK